MIENYMLPSKDSTKVIHISSVHDRNDVRIFHKQCKSLKNKGFSVEYLVADGLGNRVVDGISILDLGKPRNRFSRMFLTTTWIFFRLRHPCRDIYHLHDPELLPVGLFLSLLGRTVVFDAHESVKKQIKHKNYLPRYLRALVAELYGVIEQAVCPRLSGLIGATDEITNELHQYNKNVCTIKNLVIATEFKKANLSKNYEQPQLCYVGAITRGRCAKELAMAVQITKKEVQLKMIGHMEDRALLSELKEIDKKNRIIFETHGDRKKVEHVLAESVVGIALFKPLPNHIEALPNKLFEYMAVGLPIIASNFPMWKKLILDADCGLCCNPENLTDIAAAIDTILADRKELMMRGTNGLKNVKHNFNWTTEEENLLQFYSILLKD